MMLGCGPASMERYSLVVISIWISIASRSGANQAPQWTNFPSTLLVSEDAIIGSVVAILNASDPDDETLQFDLKGELANDILSVTSLNHTEAVVRLSKQLDREAAEEYSLLFVATDGVNVVQRWCTLFVLDVNDNRPRFSETSYYTRVSEAASIGTKVYQVTAGDPDTGVWSLVTFSLRKQSSFFMIDPVQGSLILTDNLNYNVRRAFTLELIATDGGGLSSSVSISIDVMESPSINGSKVLRCYTCTRTTDCDQRQLTYSQTKPCLSSQVCFISATEDSWGEFRYMRGCRGKSQCATFEESCTTRENRRRHCVQCCAKHACNGHQFQQHRREQARSLLAEEKQVCKSGSLKLTDTILGNIVLLFLSLYSAYPWP